MKRPSFQFYPGDWVVNQNLRRCTFHERGVWLEVMCLMHDSDEYGVLRWDLTEIAEAVGCSPQDLLSLIRKGVLKGCQPNISSLLSPLPSNGESKGGSYGASNPSPSPSNGEGKGASNSASNSASPMRADCYTFAMQSSLPFAFTPVHARKKYPEVVLIPQQEGPIWYSSRMVLDEYRRTQLKLNGNKSLESASHPQNSGLYRHGTSPMPSNGEGKGEGNGESQGASKGASNKRSKGESQGASKGASPSSSSSSSKEKETEEPPKEKSPPTPPESPEPLQSPPDGGSADAHSDFLGVGSLPTEPEPEPPTTAKARTGATGATGAEAVELPEWLPPEAWERFVRMRRAMGRSAPFTPDAQRLLLKRLASMHDQGEDVVAALDQSTENGWRGVFPVKTVAAAAPKPPASRHEVNATWGNSGKGGVIEF